MRKRVRKCVSEGVCVRECVSEGGHERGRA